MAFLPVFGKQPWGIVNGGGANGDHGGAPPRFAFLHYTGKGIFR